MRKMSKSSPGAALLLGGVLALAPALQARSCGGAGDVIGSFGWLGARTIAFVPAASAAPAGTDAITTAPPAPIVGSSTAIGILVAGAVNPTPFASVGRVYLDGAGNLLSTASPGSSASKVGAYTVNADCTISATLIDAFTPPTGPAVGTAAPTGQPSATFEGVMVQNGNEIDLTETGSVTGATIVLRKTKQYCSTADLASAYGLSAAGYVAGTSATITTNAGTTTTTTPSVPFSVLGRFVGDGAGNLYVDNIGFTSPLINREITGAYSVNTDCTGYVSLVTADKQKRGANFVIVTLGPTLNNAPQALQLAFVDAGVVGSGLAEQQ